MRLTTLYFFTLVFQPEALVATTFISTRMGESNRKAPNDDIISSSPTPPGAISAVPHKIGFW